MFAFLLARVPTEESMEAKRSTSTVVVGSMLLNARVVTTRMFYQTAYPFRDGAEFSYEKG